MSAGLPGLGLGGLFFIFSALLAPFRELWRTLTGRSRPAAWRIVGRQFAQAAVMVAAIDLTLRLIYVGLSTMGLGNAPSAVTGTVIPLTLIGMTSALLVAVLGAAKIAELAVRLRTAGLPRLPDALPRPTPLRALTLGGTATVAWLALFAAGSSELSPLVKPRGEGLTTEQRTEIAVEFGKRPSRHPTEVLSGGAMANPRASDGRRPAANPGHEPNSNGTGATLQPSVPTPSPPLITGPTPQKQPPAAAPPMVIPSPGPEGSASEPASGVSSPNAMGPPSTAGPPEGSPVPEHAGSSPHAGPG